MGPSTSLIITVCLCFPCCTVDLHSDVGRFISHVYASCLNISWFVAKGGQKLLTNLFISNETACVDIAFQRNEVGIVSLAHCDLISWQLKFDLTVKSISSDVWSWYYNMYVPRQNKCFFG